MAEKKRGSLPLKLAIALVVLGVIGYLFVRSLESTRSEPYQVNRANLSGWQLTLDRSASAPPNAPLLSLRTDIDLVSNLFRQVFLRTMESMSTPPSSSIPVVLHGEFAAAFVGRMTPEQLLSAAQGAALERAAPEPRCLVHRRISEPGSTRQVYAALMVAPALVSFRESLASRVDGAFDAAALPPVMLVGASDDAFVRWLPLQVEEKDCVAPINVSAF